MLSNRAKRLVAAFLLLLLTGWVVKKYRSRVVAADVEPEKGLSLDDVPARESAQPRE
mgnify:CR=1 FL=1